MPDEHEPGRLERAMRYEEDARKPPVPDPPEIGPFKRTFWKSPLRGPWLASISGSALLVLVSICAVTGLLSHIAYQTTLGTNSVVLGDGPLTPIYALFQWPTGLPYLYAVTQGLHVISGVAAIPLLMLKLWTVIPKLWERPAVRSMAHGLERASLGLLVGSALFLFSTGLLNIQGWYVFGFPFVPAHYLAAFIFVGALTFHLALKLPIVWRTFREQGVVRPMRVSRADTMVEDPESSESVATAPDRPTISRRGLVATVGGTSLGLAAMMAGQTVGGPFRSIALLAPRGQVPGTGPNGFQINKTASAAGIDPAKTGDAWRLEIVSGANRMELSREQLLAMDQSDQTLPIACVEGWSTTQDWTGVPLPALAALVGAENAQTVFVESIQARGSFREVTLNRPQLSDARSLLALAVNGTDLSLDHGFPARLIVPGAPGVHATKWVARIEFDPVPA